MCYNYNDQNITTLSDGVRGGLKVVIQLQVTSFSYLKITAPPPPPLKSPRYKPRFDPSDQFLNTV